MSSLATSHSFFSGVLNGIRRTGSQGRARCTRLGALMALVVAVALFALVGCGSSKPAYCSDRTKLEDSVKGLTSLNLSSGLSGLKSQLTTIQNDAKTLVGSAKSDFPSETSAVSSSVDALESAVKSLPSSPSPAQIAATASAAAGVVNSVKSFVDTSKSKCS